MLIVNTQVLFFIVWAEPVLHQLLYHDETHIYYHRVTKHMFNSTKEIIYLFSEGRFCSWGRWRTSMHHRQHSEQQSQLVVTVSTAPRRRRERLAMSLRGQQVCVTQSRTWGECYGSFTADYCRYDFIYKSWVEDRGWRRETKGSQSEVLQDDQDDHLHSEWDLSD